MDSAVPESGRYGWLHKLGALGALALGLAMLIGFLTSGDSGDTPEDLIAYAGDHSGELWFLQVTVLLAPLLIGAFVASLWVRLRASSEGLRALTLIGGTLFIAFLSTAMTLWAAPLLENDRLNLAAAEAYLAFDDAGWVLLGLAGISIGAMIISVSLAALDRGWLPKWAGWVSLALGVLSLATIGFIGFFGWTLWLIAAGLFLLLRGDRLDVVSPRDDAVRGTP
ncbi:MAG: hypothetical protein ACXWZB_01965 [Gaiellaceae bacterium]